MDIVTAKIETLFQEKLLLYQDLLEVLKQEAACLGEVDVDRLWQFSKAKQDLAVRIDEIRHQILAVLTDASIEHGMDTSSFNVSKIMTLLSAPLYQTLRRFNMSLMTLKDEIQTLAAQNKRFVEDYLKILDDLMGIITATDQNDSVYAATPHTDRRANLLLHTEV